MSLNSNNSASPREISSRSAKVNILRTTGNPSPPNTKIKCYDRLNSPSGASIKGEVDEGCAGEVDIDVGAERLDRVVGHRHNNGRHHDLSFLGKYVIVRDVRGLNMS